MRLRFLSAGLAIAAAALPVVSCGPAAPPPGTCDYAVFEGTCQLLSIEDFTPPKSPGDLRARYVTRGPTPSGAPETLVLRYRVEPRYHHMAMEHLRANPVLRCGVSHLRTGTCKPIVTTLKVPEMPGGRFAQGDLSLEPVLVPPPPP
jgi:hypothetical protein